MEHGSVALLGFGELAVSLTVLLREHDRPTHVWRRERAPGDEEARSRARDLGVQLHTDLRDAVASSGLILSCVPGTAAYGVARDAAPHLAPGALFVDAASAPPQDKDRAREQIAATGADYVDAAVLGSVAALGMKVPWLVCGPGAHRFGALARSLGLDVTVLAAPAGAAARVKLLRSVYLKGRDALVAEMLLAAHAHGLVPEVVDSLGGPADQIAFPALAQRILRSTARHAGRRADELAAAADILNGAGVAPLAANGSVSRLRALAAPCVQMPGGPGENSVPSPADLIVIAESLGAPVSPADAAESPPPHP